MKARLETRQMVLLSLLTAIVVVLQLMGAFVRFGPFAVSLVLMPIALGAALIGPKAGAWLGLVFGIVVLIIGDAAVFMPIDPFGTILVVLLKGALAGFVAGIVYKLLAQKNQLAATALSAAVIPIINTGIFILGIYVFFLPAVTQWGVAAGFTAVTEFIFLGMVGVNFLLEFALNIVFIPVIIRLIRIREATSQAG